jgi:hypothetical protein
MAAVFGEWWVSQEIKRGGWLSLVLLFRQSPSRYHQRLTSATEQ